MNLFIDTNILLNFYTFSIDDLKELDKLAELIRKGDINLILTSQVRDEVLRNRDNKIAEARNKFEEYKVETRLPQVCRNYPEYREINKALATLKEAKADLGKKLDQDIAEKNLKADKLIEKLLRLSNVIDSDKYITHAERRVELGNPPGKKKSLGDAISWEALISELREKEDLFFVSDDKDFKSALDQTAFNSFLDQEWKEKKKANLFFYTRLSDFFSVHHKDIQIRVEQEKDQLIKELSESPNFNYTHSIIAKLSRFESFTDNQIKELTSIATQNSQVYWILSDEDVKNFFRELIRGKEDLIDEEVLKLIKSKIEDEAITEEEAVEIPF